MGKIKNEQGNKYGKLTVLERYLGKVNKDEAHWICQCECGKQIVARGSKLRAGSIKSCGCSKIELISETQKLAKTKSGRKILDISNQRFGRLIAKTPTAKRKNNSVVWICECDCGNVCEVTSANLIQKLTQSCGCLKSKGESNIYNLLTSNNINFIREYNVQINGQYRRFDFAIVENNNIIRLIEFDGPQHQEIQTNGYYTKEMCIAIQQRDKEKNEYAKINNIPLVRIPYSMRDNMLLSDLMGDKYLI